MLSTFLAVLFILAYLLIAMEHSINVNKAAIALLAGVLSWMMVIMYSPAHESVDTQLSNHISEISGILFFLMGAMTIVEVIDAHKGFSVLSAWLNGIKASRLIWVIGLLSFFLSAVLDNLTTTLLMISLLFKFLPEGRLRLLYSGLIVIAANAGGVWSPIGDVTTTMLWIGGQISSTQTIYGLFLPALVNLLIPVCLIQLIIRKEKLLLPMAEAPKVQLQKVSTDSRLILYLGLIILMAVPVFKVIFHLPPFMGILFGLGIMWCFTEILNGRREEVDKKNYSVAFALRNIDTSSILFFMGILLCVSALDVSGLLQDLALGVGKAIPSIKGVLLLTGFLSAVIDNVPLVAAFQAMYPIETFSMDHEYWQMLAYCSGTGGSILIIGSAAGVVAMGIERMTFMWYLKNLAWIAALAYIGGFFTYVFLH
ncbi:MAG TPA: sodium:proton antiporter NhaD [Bacteroidia bacterium]|nr:sodium:proton antiporter NhaD [Bacteroidia bacterium]